MLKRRRLFKTPSESGQTTSPVCPDWLRGKGISGYKACECCKTTSGRVAGFVGQNILAILSALTDAAVSEVDDDRPADLALVGGFLAAPQAVPTIAPEVQAVPRNLIGKPGTAGAGAIALIGFEVWKATQALESTLTLVQTIAEAIPPIVQAGRRLGYGSCEDCIKSKVWSQAKPQVRVTGPHRPRMG